MTSGLATPPDICLKGSFHLAITRPRCHSSILPAPVPSSQDQVFQFCCRDCCEDFKRLRGVVSQCEHCRQEKLLHEKLRFSGVEKSFCSEGKEVGKGQRAL